MRKAKLAGSLLALGFAILVILPMGLARADDSTRSIRVQGTAGVDARPDQAVILAAVVEQDARAGAALEANSQEMRRVLRKLAELSVAEADIRTQGFSVTPIFERRQPGTATPRIIGYRVVNGIEVKVRDLDRLGAMLDALVSAGADRLNGIRFSISKPDSLSDQARRLAIADARRKAELYAQTAGVQVGRVLQITEQGVSVPQPRLLQATEMRAQSAVPSPPGEQKASASITVVYEIDP
jgi:uncharacterized protein YggE